MQVLDNYSEKEKVFYESVGLLVAREISAGKAAELARYSFKTYMEILEKKNIHPYIYQREDLENDLENLAYFS